MIDVEQKAAELKDKLGGRIFAFPVREQDPYSKYAVAMHTDGKWIIYPKSLDISEAAAGINLLLETLEKEGQDADYERNVRFVSYEAQINAPSVTMRRLKNDNVRTPGFVTGVDVIPKTDGEEGYHISARGLIKFSYYSVVDENLPKAVQFMDGYYQLLAMRKYGKSAVDIKREVERMSKDEATLWIERTYARYITNDEEVMNLMNGLKH